MILDLSNVSEWLNTSREVANEVIPERVLELVSLFDHAKMYSDTLEYLIKSYDSVGLYASRELLENAFDKHLCEKYPKIKGYHACKVTDESSYKSRGIIGLNRSILLELAIERFHKYTTIEKITKACENVCIRANEDNVFFFPSIENAKKTSQNHYLKCGSETLQGLSADLGLNCRGILSSQGRSCIIECDVPTKQIDSTFRLDLWRILVTYALQTKNGKEVIKKTPDLGYATYGNLNPRNIKKFHYFEKTSFSYRLPLH